MGDSSLFGVSKPITMKYFEIVISPFHFKPNHLILFGKNSAKKTKNCLHYV